MIQFQYGVRFKDGSVAHPWNGHTQHMRAAAFCHRLVAEARPENKGDYAVVRRVLPDGPWQVVDDE